MQSLVLLHLEHTRYLAGQAKKPTVPAHFLTGLIGMLALSTLCAALLLIPQTITGARLATNAASTVSRSMGNYWMA